MPIFGGGGGAIPRALVALRDIGGGLNQKSSIFSIPQNQMVILQNWYLVEDGSLIGRAGTIKFGTQALANSTVGFDREYLGTNFFLASANGTIQKGNDLSQTFSTVVSGLTVGALTWFNQYAGFVYMATKSDAPQKSSDGTTWSAMGIAAPSVAPNVADSGAAGAETGTYTAEYTWITPTIESNPSPASASVTVTAHGITVSNVAVGPAGTTSRGVYLFKTGVSSVYQKAITINDNTTTSVTITTDQNSWLNAAPSGNNPPTTGAWITVLFKNRFWKSGNSAQGARTYFSQVFVPEAWPTSFFFDLPFDKGDVVTALFVLGDLLLIFGNNQLFFIIGDTPFSFIVKQSFAQSGCPSPWAVDRVENQALYLSRFGVLAFDGSQARLITDPIEPSFSGVFPQFNSMNYNSAGQSALKYHDRLKAILISYPTGGNTVNSVCFWYFLRRTAWVQDSRVPLGWTVDNGAGGAGNLYAWDTGPTPQLRQWDTQNTYTDDGVAITASAMTGVQTGDNPETTKTWTWLTVRAQPGNYAVSINAILDQGIDNDNFSISLARGSVIGTAIIGTSTLAASIDDFEERLNLARGRGLQVRLDITYTTFVRISEIFLTYLAPGSIRRRVGISG